MRKRRLCCRPVSSVHLSVCLSVTLVYCIHMAEDIVKLLSRPGSLMLMVFGPNRRSYGNPFNWYTKYTVVGKICDFRLKSRLIPETVRERLMVAKER